MCGYVHVNVCACECVCICVCVCVCVRTHKIHEVIVIARRAIKLQCTCAYD